MAKYLLVFLFFISLQSGAYASEAAASEDSLKAHSLSLEHSVSSDGGSTSSIGMGLAMSESTALDLYYTVSSSGYDGYGVFWNRSSERGWHSWGYEFSGESGNIESHTVSVDLGIKRQSWSASVMPRFNSIHIYTQSGPKKSQSILSPGLAASYIYHTSNWDFGLQGGINYYNKRLDSYTSGDKARFLLLLDPMALQLVSGLEKSYLLASATRFHAWGEWGGQMINSISAIDFSPGLAIGAHLRYYLNSDWDLKLGYLQNQSQQNVSRFYSLLLATRW